MKNVMQPLARFLGLIVTLGLASSLQAAPALKAGDKAPAFTGKDQDGKDVKLADYAGQKTVLLYFYPRDETPGCTKQACTWRDNMEEFKKVGVQVIGVSFDTAETHKKFIENHKLNFLLLTDPEGKIVDLYGVRVPNRQMADRVSFLIGKDGTILHVTRDRKADSHVADVKEAIGKLKKD